MPGTLFKLVGSIFVDNEQANKSLAKTDSTAKKVATTLGNGIKTVGKWSAALVGGAAAVVTGVTALANNAAQALDVVDKMSQKIGISRQAYQELDYVLGQNGIDVNILQSGMKTLTAGMSAAQSGAKKNVEIFKKLGVQYKDADGTLRDTESVFYDVINALQSMENETERNAIANTLFGKSATELNPLLNAGAGNMEELTKRAHELGLVMSDELVDSGVKLGDTFDDIKKSFGAIITRLGASVMPVLQKASDLILGALPKISQFISDRVAPVATRLMDKLLPPLQKMAEDIFPQLFDLIDVLLPPFEEIVSAILPAASQLINSVLPPLIRIAKTIIPAVTSALRPLLKLIEPVTSLLEPIAKAVENIAKPIADLTEKYIKPLNEALEWLIDKTLGRLQEQLDKIQVAVAFFSALGKATNDVFGGNNKSIFPKMANGGVLEKGEIGLLEGNGAEAVVPLHNNQKWVSAVADDMDKAVGGNSAAIEALLGDILDAVERFANTGVYLDKDRLVGALAGPLDKKLGSMYAQKVRV